jgi:hypothetical protein
MNTFPNSPLPLKGGIFSLDPDPERRAARPIIESQSSFHFATPRLV